MDKGTKAEKSERRIEGPPLLRQSKLKNISLKYVQREKERKIDF